MGSARAAVTASLDGAWGLRVLYEAEPDAPLQTSVLVGVPAAGEVSMEVVETVMGRRLPVDSEAPCGHEAAQLRETGWVRGQRVAHVLLGCQRLSDGSLIAPDRIVAEMRFQPGPMPAIRVRPDRWSEALLSGVLINARQARGWRRAPARAPHSKAAGAWAQSGAQRWRLVVRQEGIYRVDCAELRDAGLGPERTPSEQVRLYYGGGRALSRTDPAGPHRLQEAAVILEDGGDGYFDEGDYLLFHGESVDRWEYDASQGAFTYRRNLYTGENTYFLLVDPGGGGRRAERRSGALTASSPLRPAGYRERLHAEQENAVVVYIANQSSGYHWYWENFRGNARNFPIEIPDALEEGVTIRLAFFGVSLTQHRLRVLWNGRQVGEVEFEGPSGFRYEVETDESPREGTNLLGLAPQSQRTLRLDWLEVEYSRRLVARDGVLDFAAPSHDGPVEYRLQGFESETARAFELSEGLAEVVDLSWIEGAVIYQDRAATSPRRYLVAEPEAWLRPTRIEAAPYAGLADPTGAAEYLILSHPEFLDEAARLAEWRGRDDRFGPPLLARAVDVQAIYDEFSGGLLDPAAIRNFVRFAYENWEPAPFFVTLLGDGTYDYRNNSRLGQGNWIPAFQDGPNTYDEWYVRVSGSDALPDLAVGRLPVNSRAEAAAVVDKLIAYDREPEPGPWQGRVLLVADDLRNPDDPGTEESEFLLDAESMVGESLPEDLDLRKLYLAEYPLEGRTKPRARDAFIRLLNEGALLVTFLGHGNHDVLAHEQMFVLSRDRDDIANGARLPLIFTAASQVGPFDRLGGPTIPEAFINQATGGAIGVISATRIGYHLTNMKIANLFHRRLFRSERSHVPVGLALMEAKQLVEAGLSEREIVQRYSLFGDPATYLAKPRLRIELEVPDTLRALQEVRAHGRLVDGQGRTVSSYDGTVELEAFDSAAPALLDGLQYERLGVPLFRGRAAVAQGQFEVRFVVPKDITYRGDRGRVTAYAWSSAQPAAFGRLADLVLTGTAAGALSDGVGPQVQIGFRGRPAFESGDAVGQRPVLVARLSDPSGINITGSTGHEIVMSLDGRAQTLTHLYEPREGGYQEGSLEAELPELEEGEHTLGLRVWDNHNNTTRETIRFRVVRTGPRIAGLQLYPNPITASGHFSFEMDADTERVRVQVYTLAGRLVDEVEGSGSRGYHQVAWSPSPALANGTYLCRVAALDGQGRWAAATIAAVVMR